MSTMMACCCGTPGLCEGFVCNYDQIRIQPTVSLHTNYTEDKDGSWERCSDGSPEFIRNSDTLTQILSVSLVITCDIIRDGDGNATGFLLNYESGENPIDLGLVSPYSIALEGRAEHNEHVCCGHFGNAKSDGYSVLELDYENQFGFEIPYGIGSISCSGGEYYYPGPFDSLDCIPKACWMRVVLGFRIYGRWYSEWTGGVGDNADCPCPESPPSGEDTEGGSSGKMNGGSGQPVSVTFFCRIPGNDIDNAIDNCIQLPGHIHYEHVSPFPNADMSWGGASYSGCARYYEGWGWDCQHPDTIPCLMGDGTCFMCECEDAAVPGAVQNVTANWTNTYPCSCDIPQPNDCCSINAGHQVSGSDTIDRNVRHQRYIDLQFLGGT